MKLKIIIALGSLWLSFTTLAHDAHKSDEWRTLDTNKTVLLTLPQGKVVIELAPQFSPKHVEQFIKLTKSGHYDGNKFYRVIDGFVAQGGPEDGSTAVSVRFPLAAFQLPASCAGACLTPHTPPMAADFATQTARAPKEGWPGRSKGRIGSSWVSSYIVRGPWSRAFHKSGCGSHQIYLCLAPSAVFEGGGALIRID